jgi:predicted PurR-regulated permease PerM
MRGNWTFAILLFVWGVLVVATADGILRCRVVSGRVKVNPLLITLALMGGVSVFGPIGFFAGPVVVVLLVSLIRILREEHASVYESRQRVA